MTILDLRTMTISCMTSPTHHMLYSYLRYHLLTKNFFVFFFFSSSDDPFVLYATLYSGKDALFVSGDFMRDHKFNLGVHLKDVFVRWQKSRQIVNFQVFHDGVTICVSNICLY
jgi:hypothetical protein